MTYRNKKNGRDYRVLNPDVKITDATNATEGREMILYCDQDNNFYVRERSEFERKFERVEG